MVMALDLSADSMSPYLRNIKTELSWLVNETVQSNPDVDVRVAVVAFGGASQLLVPFTVGGLL